MRVLVTGSRDWHHPAKVHYEIEEQWLNSRGDFVVIHGDARGVDRMAAQWVEVRHNRPGIRAEFYPAEWEKYGKAAGPIRNRRMVDEGKPDLCLAFIYNDSRGASGCVSYARSQGVPCRVWRLDETGRADDLPRAVVRRHRRVLHRGLVSG